MNRVFLLTPPQMGRHDTEQLRTYLSTSSIPTETALAVGIEIEAEATGLNLPASLVDRLGYGEMRRVIDWANTAIIFENAHNSAHFLAGLMAGQGKRVIIVTDAADPGPDISWVYPERVQGFEEAFDRLKGVA